MKGDHHIALVVSPLRALMKEQIETWSKRLDCVGIFPKSEMTKEDIEGVEITDLL